MPATPNRPNPESVHAEIQRLAYRLWQQAHCPPDQDLAFWLEAETQILTTRPVIETPRSPKKQNSKRIKSPSARADPGTTPVAKAGTTAAGKAPAKQSKKSRQNSAKNANAQPHSRQARS